MRIKKIQLKNGYKRFHDLTIDLGDNPKRIIALVGPNGCGKSSVLDGLMFHANAYGQIGDKGNKDYKYHSMSQLPNYNYQNIDILFSNGQKFDLIRNEKAKTGKENTIFSFRSSYRYNSNLKVSQSQATPDIRLNNYGATSASDIDDKMENNYRRLYIKYNKYLNDNDCKPSEAKAKIIGDLNDSISKCLALTITSIGDIESDTGTLYFSKTDHPSEFEFNVLSSGEKEVVDILLDLYLRKDEYSDSVYLIDEPELHISTSIQKNMIIEIEKMIPNECQIWITTHSIGLLRALQDELCDKSDIIMFDVNNQWAKEKYLLSPMLKTRKNWQEILATALDDITTLLAPKRIVYCEGRDKPAGDGSDKGFDAKVYNTIFESEYPDTLFISSGGNTELDQRSEFAVAIIGKALPETEILVLKDRDMASGKFVDEQARQEYLNLNNDNHRVLRRYEIENYLFDEVVLRKYCESNGHTFDKAAYDALNLDILNGDIKSKCNNIKNICGVVGSINAEKFKIVLSAFLTFELPIYTELKEVIFDRK